MWQSRSTDPGINFIIEERTDLADATLQEYDEKRSKQKNAPKGVSRFVVPVSTTGEPLPEGGLAREEFFKRAAMEARDVAAEFEDSLGVRVPRPQGGYNPADYGDGIVEST